jgi:hypothetical protein
VVSFFWRDGWGWFLETVVTRRSLGNDFENHLEAAYFVPSGNMGGPRVSEGNGGGVPSGSKAFAFPDRNMVPFVLFFEGNTQGFAPGTDAFCSRMGTQRVAGVWR